MIILVVQWLRNLRLCRKAKSMQKIQCLQIKTMMKSLQGFMRELQEIRQLKV